MRRLLPQPWIMAIWTAPLGTVVGVLSRSLTATGVILTRLRRDGKTHGHLAGLSIEHRDHEDRLVGQAYLEAQEADLLIELILRDEFRAQFIGPEIVAVELNTRDGLSFGWFGETNWGRTQRDWAIEMRLRNDIAFALPVEKADELRAFLQDAVEQLRGQMPEPGDV